MFELLNRVIMRYWILFAAVYVMLMGDVVCASQCYDLHLSDGSIVRGIQYDVEEVFGSRYIVYHYAGSARVHRIEHARVQKITPGECAEVPPEPTRPPMAQASGNSPKSSEEFWKKIQDILEDSNPVRRKNRWDTAVKNRRITLCGEVTKIVPGYRKYRVNLISHGPGDLSENPLSIEAFLPASQKSRLAKIDLGQIVCLNGRITRTRHVSSSRYSSQPGYENYRLMEELEMLMEPQRILCDFVLGECRIESVKPAPAEDHQKKPDVPEFHI